MSGRSKISLAVAFFCMVGPIMAQGQSSDLPAGLGKEVVQSVCTACHKANQITRSSGYSHAGWRELIGTMIDLSGSPEQEAITEYLATHFPENTRRQPKLIPGSASISFKEWKVPTLGQRSRDPVQAPDGSIWWAGQWGNLI
ncbi:MAG: cytochrome C, partial [Candidatus Tectomicrobia bacterium]|nr:cytochrome C [Candidatus Tectomicrobia bacterium]